jgi:pimeloyl-ACP methyl ester carboxylesterase
MPIFQAHDDVSIFYTLQGDPSNPPFLLLHGWTCDSHDWSWQIPFLTESYYVIALDHRGHGRSTAPQDSSFDPFTLSSDAVALLKHLNIALPVYVMGHSMGGVTTSVLATKHPEVVKAMVLIDPPYWRPNDVVSIFANVRATMTDEVSWAQDIFKGLVIEETPAWMKTWYDRRIAGTGRNVIWGCIAGLFAEGGVGMKEIHEKLVEGKREQPRLAVYAKEENAEMERELGMREKDMVVAMEGLGHWPHQVESEKFNELLGKWLENVQDT